MATFIIADDHPITLTGMKTFVEKLGHKILGTFDNGISAYNNIIALNPEYVILDLSMPSMNGLEVLEKIRLSNKSIKIIIYTMYNETALFNKAVKLEVNGYILKEFAMQEIETCITTLAYKKEWFSPKLNDTLTLKNTDDSSGKILTLTPSERKIISLIAEEKNSKQIADLLFVSEKTVENHRGNIIKKLNINNNNKNGLLIWAISNKHLL